MRKSYVFLDKLDFRIKFLFLEKSTQFKRVFSARLGKENEGSKTFESIKSPSFQPISSSKLRIKDSYKKNETQSKKGDLALSSFLNETYHPKQLTTDKCNKVVEIKILIF